VLRGSVEALAPERGGGLPERLRRDFPLAAGDLGVALLSYLLTLVLRFDGSVPTRYWSSFWRFLPVALAIHLLVHQLCGLYEPMWRYASVHEARRIVLAGTVGGAGVVLASLVVGWQAGGLRALPLSVTIFGAILALLGSGAIRFQSRLFVARLRPDGSKRRGVLIVGAGSAGSMLLKDLLRSPSLGLRPVGLVDDDRRKLGRRLHGVAVLGSRMAIPRLVEQLQAGLVLLAIPSATSELVREVAGYDSQAVAVSVALSCIDICVDGSASRRSLSAS
jgi:FlaA1/EpsC-like NDP-sugar epimerase